MTPSDGGDHASPATTSVLGTLEKARYLSLATFRKNGRAVATPVWFARLGDLYYVFSAGDAGKVKRLKNSARARIARCDARGRLLGPSTDTEAKLVADPSERERAFQALRSKYGWQMRLLDVFSQLAGQINKREVIAVRVPSDVDDKGLV